MKSTELFQNGNILLDSSFNLRNLDIRFRKSKPGPEEDMVKLFLSNLKIRVPNEHKVTLFKEPQIESGFPDIVLVIWDFEIARKWNEARLKLNSNDLKVIHMISMKSFVEIKKLNEIYGKKIVEILEKLENAKMIYREGEQIYSRPIPEIFAVRNIIAIEAKISGWKAALEQAFINSWFASSSFILVPEAIANKVLKKSEFIADIGVLNAEKTTINSTKFPSMRTPISYASWLFNEWSWKTSINLKRENIKCNG